jgi:hypothetical protein
VKLNLCVYMIHGTCLIQKWIISYIPFVSHKIFVIDIQTRGGSKK